MNTTALIRPAWTPATIALMVIGFMVFWPLGFAMLAYIIWGDRLDGFKRDVNRATDGIFAGCRRGSDKAARWGHGGSRPHRQRRLRRLAREGTRAPRRRAPQARRHADASSTTMPANCAAPRTRKSSTASWPTATSRPRRRPSRDRRKLGPSRRRLRPGPDDADQQAASPKRRRRFRVAATRLPP